jgi:chromosome segregation protein
VHLRSITLKGFKSFPNRTKLEFGPGVAVIIGPNGSGKSNITDAVLWALGEQSPLAVRGQTMQDVIFAGGHGIASRREAEVEVVIDNSDGGLNTEFSEISIVRFLGRDGESGYRLNGARCRLIDITEVLSDSGLGKEMHSVVSQGRVEAIIHSKPRDRRLLIEEAAGLGKHRKRRRRAQLKLERTEENLSRALDVDREARSRLKPLKRQAEAAELHERLERQSLEARYELSRERVRAVQAQLASAEGAAAAARGERDEAERLLAEVARRREAAEEAFAAHSREREQLAGAVYAARSAAEQIGLRAERAREVERSAVSGISRRRRELEAVEEVLRTTPAAAGGSARIAELEAELAVLDREREARLDEELAELNAQRASAVARRAEAAATAERLREQLERAEATASQARNARREAERASAEARSESAQVAAELAAVNRFLASAPGALGGARSLADQIDVEPGYELALSAALGSLLRAGLVDNVREAESLLDAHGRDGGITLIRGLGGQVLQSNTSCAIARPDPPPGARRLLDHIRPDPAVAAVVERLLGSTVVVDAIESVPNGFAGVAVTAAGRVYDGSTGALRQAHSGGEEKILAERNRREQLAARADGAAGAERAARQAVAEAQRVAQEAEEALERADRALRTAFREKEQAAEAASRAEWLIERRREAPDEGPAAVKRARIEAELAAERRLEERTERERRERVQHAQRLRARIERGELVAATAARTVEVLGAAADSVGARHVALATELTADEAVGERTAAELRACAHDEVSLQARLRRASEGVTQAEVSAQQVRDEAADVGGELNEVAERLGLPAEPAEAGMDVERRAELEGRIERLARRRESLGPVNPLAKEEYDDAIAHVEELEAQRTDLEAAMAELKGLIKETDRRIRESFEQTFEAAARNFEDVVQHLFPGGRGRLRLVQPEGPRPVLGGEAVDGDAATAAEAEEPEVDESEAPGAGEPGVEVEVTPAGKSMKRLSLLSGGEKSLVALAFMFAVFLARPCPFYILDEVEAALDDLNIDRFLQLVRRFSNRAQFVVVTHQKRTMDAADTLYGVSMGADGVSRVISRRLGAAALDGEALAEPAAPAPATAASEAA